VAVTNMKTFSIKILKLFTFLTFTIFSWGTPTLLEGAKTKALCATTVKGVKAKKEETALFEDAPGFPALISQRHMPRYLDGTFPRFSRGRVKLGIAGVRRGEALYRRLRTQAGLSPLPLELTSENDSSSHTYWEISTQGFIVTAWMREVTKIDAASAAMAYFLHDVDDVADKQLPTFISKLSAAELNLPVGDFLAAYFSQGYKEFYDLLMIEVQRALPYFDRASFDKATMRMILGSALLSKYVVRAKREKFQQANKQQHVELLYSRPQIQNFLDNEVSNAYYAGTVKSLPDGIFSFYEQRGVRFDPALMTLFGILTVPGLVGENVDYEQASGEFTSEGKIDIGEVARTLDLATAHLVDCIRHDTFDPLQLRAFLAVYIAYGDAFKKVLRGRQATEESEHFPTVTDFRKNQWDLHEHSLYEIQKALDAKEVKFE
jgi:hypothetical protein